jgi:hypothetical protein
MRLYVQGNYGNTFDVTVTEQLEASLRYNHSQKYQGTIQIHLPKRFFPVIRILDDGQNPETEEN